LLHTCSASLLVLLQCGAHLKGYVIVLDRFALAEVARDSPTAWATAGFRHELDTKRRNFVLAALLSILALPRSIPEASLHEDRLAFAEIFAAALSLLAEYDHIDEARIVLPLIPLLHAVIDRQSQRGHRCPRRCIAYLWVAREVAQKYHVI
jgi:hypothetical protein